MKSETKEDIAEHRLCLATDFKGEAVGCLAAWTWGNLAKERADVAAAKLPAHCRPQTCASARRSGCHWMNAVNSQLDSAERELKRLGTA